MSLTPEAALEMAGEVCITGRMLGGSRGAHVWVCELCGRIADALLAVDRAAREESEAQVTYWKHQTSTTARAKVDADYRIEVLEAKVAGLKEMATQTVVMLKLVANEVPNIDWTGAGCCPFCEPARLGEEQPPCQLAALIAKLDAALSAVGDPPKAPAVDKVGCERPDGTLNVHLEEEFCEVCAPSKAPAEYHEPQAGVPGPEDARFEAAAVRALLAALKQAHQVIADQRALIDPEEYPELNARAMAILGPCDEPGRRCPTVPAPKAQPEAMEALRASDRALEHAFEWLDEVGCDCGTDEPGTCAWCEVQAVRTANRAVLEGQPPPKAQEGMGELVEAAKHAVMEWRLHGQLTDSCRKLEAALAKVGQ